MIFDLQKASIGKRFVAFILDMILFAVLAAGGAWLIGLACDYDSHLDHNISTQEAFTTYYYRAHGVDFSKNYDSLGEAEKADWDAHEGEFSKIFSADVALRMPLEKLLSYQSKYLQSHGVDLFLLDTEFNALTTEQKTNWLAAYDACSAEIKAEYGEGALLMKAIKYVQYYENEHKVDLTATELDRSNYNKEELKDWEKAYKECDKTLKSDLTYSERMMKIIAFTLLMVSLGVLISMLVLEFILPLVFKNGQTIGKKIFGIAVIHQNGVRVNNITMFIRTFLGKYAVETMSPVLLILMLFTGNALIAIIVFALLIILELVLFIWKKDTRPFIHDVFAKTVCVDMASQMIFDTEAEMLEFRRNAYAESSDSSATDTLYGTKNSLASSFVEVNKDRKNGSDSTDEGIE